MDFSSSDIVKLAELLKPPKNNSDSEDSDSEQINNAEPLPTDVGKKPKPSVYAKLPHKDETKKYDPMNPESEEKLYFNEESEVISDWRKTPQWDISYKQKVTASDVFLQMGAKSPATASCEDMILKIHLPEEDHRNIDLKIKESSITLVSPKYKLDAPLPHPVDPQRGNAQWDQDAENLVVTLRMNREFDFINF
ncbi:hypothetical protein RN001_008389 [Aquatica leii]|uniref:PIH1D1/2/3 CS-like domain-containing protein n=1 Tax=Aquatica leii TaxID=1421715 RepID=A0AAN7SP80_9COLE|nr:hypothetical protein RN001_008389 [Aquatica leii]